LFIGDDEERDVEQEEQDRRGDGLFKEGVPPLVRCTLHLRYREAGEADGCKNDEEEENDESCDEYKGEREEHERRDEEEQDAHEADERGIFEHFFCSLGIKRPAVDDLQPQLVHNFVRNALLFNRGKNSRRQLVSGRLAAVNLRINLRREEIARIYHRLGYEEREIEKDSGDQEHREHLLPAAVPVHIQDGGDADGEEAEDEEDIADVAHNAPRDADADDLFHIAPHRDDGVVHRAVQRERRDPEKPREEARDKGHDAVIGIFGRARRPQFAVGRCFRGGDIDNSAYRWGTDQAFSFIFCTCASSSS